MESTEYLDAAISTLVKTLQSAGLIVGVQQLGEEDWARVVLRFADGDSVMLTQRLAAMYFLQGFMACHKLQEVRPGHSEL